MVALLAVIGGLWLGETSILCLLISTFESGFNKR
ncbi:MAG: hypothetical protein ACJA0T_001183 [Colwellia sp.]|jgi:hypothetical protein